MADSAKAFFNVKTTGIVLAVSAVWFLLFAYLLTPFVPADHPGLLYLVSAATAACITGVFFVGAYMFSLVASDPASPRDRD